MSLEDLKKLVAEGEVEKSEALAQKLLEQGVDPIRTIQELADVMIDLGDKFSRLEVFLPEIMLAGDAMTAVVNILRPRVLASGEKGAAQGKVVLGVVKGDVHAIGKDIVKLMLQTNGYEVKDLGADAPSLQFIKAAQEMGADFIGASALMTTTMPGQKEIIALLKEIGLNGTYKVVIGGAPVGQEWADLIGADLYCPDASSAPGMMAKLLKK
ncbi:MAG: cobalamin-dependent protein [Desulfobacterales bacterium]|nr:MAG: cobalamin-dependent protein [Desulfobacterales bacterium]